MHNKQAQNFANAIGVIRYKMTNDYMFRYILQKNEKVLKGLICSLLCLKPQETPEFYATYKMLNIKNHHVYSDKFVLAVVDLSRIDLATDEDVACGLEHWARLFKASFFKNTMYLFQEK